LGRGEGAGGGGGGRERAGTFQARGFTAGVEDVTESLASAGRSFGEDKVFIGDAYDEARKRGYRGALDDFKRELVAEHFAGRLKLARADLVGAMDPATVMRSEVPKTGLGQGSDFHFIRRRRK
jgi:hypothetical protein